MSSFSLLHVGMFAMMGVPIAGTLLVGTPLALLTPLVFSGYGVGLLAFFVV